MRAQTKRIARGKKTKKKTPCQDPYRSPPNGKLAKIKLPS
jgi:hypothetical protein